MITDPNKALKNVHAALTRAGYTATLVAGDGRVEVRSKDGTYRGAILVGKYMDSTTLTTLKIRRVALDACSGC
jgi:hypothetical protein